MQKLSAVNFDSDILINDVLSEDTGFGDANFGNPKTLSACVNYFSSNPYTGLSLNSELPDKKAISIAKKLACALDKNSTSEIKLLKSRYGSTQEFLAAKEFLNRKCKIIWDVFDNKNLKINAPYEAMKTLGITNCPTLEFLLQDSLKLFEKDNGNTTVEVIKFILKNENFNYTFDNIFDYLSSYYKKNNCKYNINTMKFLALQLKFDRKKLTQVGIDKNIAVEIFKTLTLREKLGLICKFLSNVSNTVMLNLIQHLFI